MLLYYYAHFSAWSLTGFYSFSGATYPTLHVSLLHVRSSKATYIYTILSDVEFVNLFFKLFSEALTAGPAGVYTIAHSVRYSANYFIAALAQRL